MLSSNTTFSHKARYNYGTMEKQFQEEKTKVLYITHISTFAITILPTLHIKKKKILCPHKLGYSDIYKAQSPQSGFVRWVGNQGS